MLPLESKRIFCKGDREMRFRLSPTESEILEIFPNRGGKISVRDGGLEVIVEGGIPKHIATNSVNVLISLGVIIMTPDLATHVNRNSIFLKGSFED